MSIEKKNTILVLTIYKEFIIASYIDADAYIENFEQRWTIWLL